MADLMIGKTDDGAKLPVNVDTHGRVVISGTVSSIGNVETILNSSLAIETVMAADLAATRSSAASIAGMAIPPNNRIVCTNTTGKLTKVEYYDGYVEGVSAGTLVATTDITYDANGDLETVTTTL